MNEAVMMQDCQLRPQSGPLAGRHIVVTRPAGQARQLADAIFREGGSAVLFPVLAIRDIDDPAGLADIASRLDSFDLAIFISPNAVSKALKSITARRAWPLTTRVATMGAASERELAQFGFSDIIAPKQRFDSEALLDMPALQDMAGKHVVIFRGDGGRELLGDTLAARGATIEHVACYRRGRPDLDAAPLLKLWARGELDAITVTSSEGVRNLFDMVGSLGQSWLRKTPLFASHQRIALQASRLGLEKVSTTEPGDEGLLAGLIAYFARPEAVRSIAADDPGSAARDGH